MSLGWPGLENGDSEGNIEADSRKLHFLACLPWERPSLPNPSGNQGQNWVSLLCGAPPAIPKLSPLHPIPHTQTTEENCLPLFIFAPLAPLLFMPSPCLILFLPAVTVFYSACCFWGLERQWLSPVDAWGGGLGGEMLLVCADSARTKMLLPG